MINLTFVHEPGFHQSRFERTIPNSISFILKLQPKALSCRGVFIVSSCGWVTSILT